VRLTSLVRVFGLRAPAIFLEPVWLAPLVRDLEAGLRAPTTFLAPVRPTPFERGLTLVSFLSVPSFFATPNLAEATRLPVDDLDVGLRTPATFEAGFWAPFFPESLLFSPAVDLVSLEDSADLEVSESLDNGFSAVRVDFFVPGDSADFLAPAARRPKDFAVVASLPFLAPAVTAEFLAPADLMGRAHD